MMNTNSLIYGAFINDEQIGEAEIIGFNGHGHNYQFKPYKKHLEKILNYTISDFPDSIFNILCSFELDEKLDSSWMFKPLSVNIIVRKEYENVNGVISQVIIHPDMDNWLKKFSLKNFASHLESFCKSLENVNCIRNDFDFISSGFGISITFEPNVKIDEIYNETIDKFTEIIINTIQNCQIELRKNSVRSVFKFPEEIKEPCEQYLVYFSKFLADIGIEALTTIEEEAKSVLFTVTPKEPSTALSQIRDALDIYLKIPTINNLDNYAIGLQDLGVNQLISNVHFLKSQLLLSQSIIQAKNTTIENLQLLNFQQKLLLSDAENNPSNEEKVLNEIVTIKEFDGKGFNINLPKLFRLIRRKLS
ncbi:hypothetical protein EYD46_09340 [Hyunsoonleella pacifica]|uniref:Uncharacterized protein n=2 Tax=Hyunsoonleella pacifica TaxID=1080224 RepID=A0A4Q9FQ42_9FLAO|nr:hypothetical protein EYD46_09340 [Hyunsoonleella pacifica]